MAENTKTKILEVALELFSKNGYLGTSMNDIATKLKISKPALYKHYLNKHEILESIIKSMNEMDKKRAFEYEMPEVNLKGFEDAYLKTPLEKIEEFTLAQFSHWTREEFPSRFRKMLTIEQYKDMEMANLYQHYLSTGPLNYMTKIFRKMTNSDIKAMQLALNFYGPIYLLYGVYDALDDKEAVLKMLRNHIDHFIENMKSSGERK
ncbi:MAG TPA: TetR/AcrR family transcriptional regulator [Firmicutes bacterium]|nr:TetR/AcrR family transcriptional regulator [Bacillota bacterium]